MARYNNLEQGEKNKAEALSLLQIVVKTGEITDIQLVHDIFEQLGRHTHDWDTLSAAAAAYKIGCIMGTRKERRKRRRTTA